MPAWKRLRLRWVDLKRFLRFMEFTTFFSNKTAFVADGLHDSSSRSQRASPKRDWHDCWQKSIVSCKNFTENCIANDNFLRIKAKHWRPRAARLHRSHDSRSHEDFHRGAAEHDTLSDYVSTDRDSRLISTSLFKFIKKSGFAGTHRCSSKNVQKKSIISDLCRE